MSSDLTVAAPASAIGGTAAKWTVTSSGQLEPTSDNAASYDIGEGAKRPRFVYVGSALLLSDGASITQPGAVSGDTMQMSFGSSGLRFRNTDGLGFYFEFSPASLSADRVLTAPDVSGVIATDTPVSSLQTLSGNGATIATTGIKLARVTANGAARTGLILASGTYSGQTVFVTNEDTTAINTLTFAAAGTSHVAGGALAIINGNQGREFRWNGTAWFENN